MADFLNALSKGLARFVYAWLGPAIVTVSTFALLVLPDVQRKWPTIRLRGRGITFEKGFLFAFAVFTLSVLFAYAAQPIYRLLEGYPFPKWLRRSLIRRHRRQAHRLRHQISLLESRPWLRSGREWGPLLEKVQRYPERDEDLLPTRLGNALRGLERYGKDRFGLDSQSLWFEVEATSPPGLLHDYEDARAQVDFFVSSIAHLGLLALVSMVLGVALAAPGPVLVSLVSLALAGAAYEAAVINMGEWHDVVQAMVNLSRAPLAAALGFTLPEAYGGEFAMWESFSDFVANGAVSQRSWGSQWLTWRRGSGSSDKVARDSAAGQVR